MPTSVTLNEFLNRDRDHINQVVYKVDGNFNGNITCDNVTVILMGDGNINGNINAGNGEVVLIRGDINGSVKADKVICPSVPNAHTQVDAKYSEREFVKRQKFISIPGNDERYKCNTCFDCAHLRFGLNMGVMVCNVTNESSYRLTPCENFERRYK